MFCRGGLGEGGNPARLLSSRQVSGTQSRSRRTENESKAMVGMCKFRREFDAFGSMEASRRLPFATRDYIARAVCPQLYGMHTVKLGLLLVFIGGALVSSLLSLSSERDGASVEEEEGKQDTADGDPVRWTSLV
jgi:hypothetical protein